MILYLLDFIMNSNLSFTLSFAQTRRIPEFSCALRWVTPLNKELREHTEIPIWCPMVLEGRKDQSFHKEIGLARLELIIRERERILFGAHFVQEEMRKEKKKGKRERTPFILSTHGASSLLSARSFANEIKEKKNKSIEKRARESRLSDWCNLPSIKRASRLPPPPSPSVFLSFSLSRNAWFSETRRALTNGYHPAAIG